MTRRRRTAIVACSIAAILLIWFGSTPLKEVYLIGRIRRAKTKTEQLDAFRLVNKWGGRFGISPFWEGYACDFYDDHGDRMVFCREDFELTSCASVGIEFPSGRTVRVDLVEKGAMGMLLRD